MKEDLIDIRTELAASPRTRVEIGRDGVLHVLAGPVTLHLDRAVCEELTTTLAKAMVILARSRAKRRRPTLCVVNDSVLAVDEPRDAAPVDAAQRCIETTSQSKGTRE
jgi:hypothetical protein